MKFVFILIGFFYITLQHGEFYHKFLKQLHKHLLPGLSQPKNKMDLLALLVSVPVSESESLIDHRGNCSCYGDQESFLILEM